MERRKFTREFKLEAVRLIKERSREQILVCLLGGLKIMAKFTVRRIIVEPGTKLPKRKPTYEEIGLRGDMSQFYPLKALFERLLGKPTYMRLKESAHFPSWKEATIKLLDAMHLSIVSTVRIADKHWFDDVREVIQRGRKELKRRDTIADLFATLAATLIELSFTQMGGMPRRRYPSKTIPLDPRNWTFDAQRTVQYVQNAEQRKVVQDEQDKLAENLKRIEAEEAAKATKE